MLVFYLRNSQAELGTLWKKSELSRRKTKSSNSFQSSTRHIIKPNLKFNFSTHDMTFIFFSVRADTKTKIGEDETAILSCSRKKIVFRRIIHENDKCQRDLSLLNIRKKCNGEHQCEFRIKDLAKLPGQSNECRSENIGPAYIKYHCKAGKKNILYIAIDRHCQLS